MSTLQTSPEAVHPRPVAVPVPPTKPAHAPRPAARQPERYAAVLEAADPCDPEGWFALTVTFTKNARARRSESWTYLAREIPAEGMGRGCRGFELEKLDRLLEPTGEVYHVLIDPRDGYSSCDCLGGEHHGHCKHREGIAALIQAGQLKPRYRSGADMARNDPTELDRHLDSLADFGGEPADEMDTVAWE